MWEGKYSVFIYDLFIAILIVVSSRVLLCV